ncbi:unnamed protein product [Allacma fusca]|uniref:ACB domain-containing protein n=1 Tax=Allacma fusca TaxID=39272 RepID=A0A8J2MBI1_9HEXA|nr:unnamed protein product [Allacma fusca]
MSTLRFLVVAGRYNSHRTSPQVQQIRSHVRTLASLQNRFLDTSLKIQTVFEATTTDEKLKIYALYKQGTKGKNFKAKPPPVDFEGAAKWKAWDSLGNMSQEEAQQKYVDLVNSILLKAGKEPVV